MITYESKMDEHMMYSKILLSLSLSPTRQGKGETKRTCRFIWGGLGGAAITMLVLKSKHYFVPKHNNIKKKKLFHTSNTGGSIITSSQASVFSSSAGPPDLPGLFHGPTWKRPGRSGGPDKPALWGHQLVSAQSQSLLSIEKRNVGFVC